MKIHILIHAAGIKSETETEDSQEASNVNETEGGATVPESNGEDSTPKQEEQQDYIGTEAGQSTFSYEQLKAKSENPVTGIDFKRREVGSTLNMTRSYIVACNFNNFFSCHILRPICQMRSSRPYWG